MQTYVSLPQQQQTRRASVVGGPWAPCLPVPDICWEGFGAELISRLFIFSILFHFLQQHLLQRPNCKRKWASLLKGELIMSPSFPLVLDKNLSS